MTHASHYVFMDLDELIKNKRYTKLDEISRRYSTRYHKDEELVNVCDNITTLISSDGYDGLETVRCDLKELINNRKMLANGK